jgi:hypothetical protein
MSKWAHSAGDDLFRFRNRSGLWGYRSDGSSSVEATALACLGLLACRQETPSQKVASVVTRAAEWLATMQNSDGSLGVCAALPEPGWATPYAVLLWSALDTMALERQRAAAWLLAQKGLRLTFPVVARRAIEHDPTLVGWPWIENTHSWLEPTALAVLALARMSLVDHPRAHEGLLVITDRALPHGGWNYGNKAVFGQELRPQPGPTGMALLALATRATKRRPRVVEQGIAYLGQTLPGVTAPISLGWGVLGLRAWDAAPRDAQDWLSQSHALAGRRRDSAVGLGLLLLAGGERALEFLGSRPTKQIVGSAGGTNSDRPHDGACYDRSYDGLDQFRDHQA